MVMEWELEPCGLLAIKKTRRRCQKLGLVLGISYHLKKKK